MKKIGKVKDFISSNKYIFFIFLSVLIYYSFFVFADISFETSNDLIAKRFGTLQKFSIPISLIMTIVCTRLFFIKNFVHCTRDKLASKLYKLSFIPYKITVGLATFAFILGDSASIISFNRIQVFILAILLLVFWFCPVYAIVLTYQIMYKKRFKL